VIDLSSINERAAPSPAPFEVYGVKKHTRDPWDEGDISKHGP
jgi:hypothetical protein